MSHRNKIEAGSVVFIPDLKASGKVLMRKGQRIFVQLFKDGSMVTRLRRELYDRTKAWNANRFRKKDKIALEEIETAWNIEPKLPDWASNPMKWCEPS